MLLLRATCEKSGTLIKSCSLFLNIKGGIFMIIGCVIERIDICSLHSLSEVAPHRVSLSLKQQFLQLLCLRESVVKSMRLPFSQPWVKLVRGQCQFT